MLEVTPRLSVDKQCSGIMMEFQGFLHLVCKSAHKIGKMTSPHRMREHALIQKPRKLGPGMGVDSWVEKTQRQMESCEQWGATAITSHKREERHANV